MEQKTEFYNIQLKSPMGWIKIKAQLVNDSETTFHGEAKLMGFTVPLTDCVKNGMTYNFKAAPKLPFGVLPVTITADIQDGIVTGVANAPRHKPMEIKGSRTAE